MIRCKCFDFIPPFVRPLIRSSVVVGGDIACLGGGKGAAGRPASRCSVASSYFCCLVFPPSIPRPSSGGGAERMRCFAFPPSADRATDAAQLRSLLGPSSSQFALLLKYLSCTFLPLPSFLPIFCHGPVTNEALLLRPQKQKLQLETSNSQNQG